MLGWRTASIASLMILSMGLVLLARLILCSTSLDDKTRYRMVPFYPGLNRPILIAMTISLENTALQNIYQRRHSVKINDRGTEQLRTVIILHTKLLLLRILVIKLHTTL
jgi:hypothetical protein